MHNDRGFMTNLNQTEDRRTHFPADILGQVVRLQMVLPSSSFSWMTRTKFQSTR